MNASPAKKKIRYSPKQGDMVSIKLKAGKFALAKVAFVSEHHKGVLLFRVYDHLFAAADAPAAPPTGYRCQFRSLDAYVKAGRWTLVGHDPATQGDQVASRYVTASGLFEGDKRLRDVRESDRETILPMEVHFYASAERLLKKQFGIA